MITSEFLAELQKVRTDFHWSLIPHSERVPERRRLRRLSIRASSKAGDAEGVLFDPIGAVCYAWTGQVYLADSWIEAANAIGLTLIDAADLVAASNDRTWRPRGALRETDPYMVNLRRRLARTVDLGPSDRRQPWWFRLLGATLNSQLGLPRR